MSSVSSPPGRPSERCSAPSGQPLDRTLEWRINAPAAAPPSGDPTPHYRLGSTVPDYWLPYLPVKLYPAGHLQLRRGRLPNVTTGPQGRMLAEETAMFLEEVPRRGRSSGTPLSLGPRR